MQGQDPQVLLALDQGTTSTRAIAFDRTLRPLHVAQRPLPQSFPRPGWVEHDPERIRDDAVATLREVIDALDGGAEAVAAIGITNQRETTLVWERATGRPIHAAIVWQDRRTADACRELRRAGHEDLVRRRTGLVLDPYFSATKLAWILDAVDGARAAAARGELAFGTVDVWLLWCLTGGTVHATDVSNASRTALFDIDHQRWDPELLDLFGIPVPVLPEVRDSAGDFGTTLPELFGAEIPIRGIAGDQQAALFGQAAFEPGGVKCTFGTGAFALMNTGTERLHSENRLLTTIGWRIDGRTTYALEGSIFVAGATVQWLRDGLGIIDDPTETERLAGSVDDTGGVYLVPAFVGLGAPHWDADARGALVGLTRDTGRASIARAGLEAVAYQTRQLLEAMRADGASGPRALRVDGGFARNDWAMGFLADLVDVRVERPAGIEITALGAASLAGLASGVFGSLDAVASAWRLDRAWEPTMEESRRAALYEGWKEAVGRVRSTNPDR
ncbi:MAG TPA: glycerol kinase GlpK [Gemmatimonadota bacterium]|nr:glycerol kinase GlpK [Gemmatimonadota bacterium]